LKESNFTYLPNINSIENYFDSLRNLIREEELCEKEEYWELIKQSSKKVKREAGILWSSVTLEDISFSDSVGITLTLKRNPDLIKPAIHPGQNVKLYRDSSSNYVEIIGIVKKINKEEAQISIHLDEVPTWLEDGFFSLEKTFSDTTYKAMYYAIDTFENSKDKISFKYKKIFFDKNESTKIKSDNLEISSSLNPSQKNAILNLLNSNDLFLIHGPPGTGKTTVIIESVKNLVSSGEVILLTASSNLAVDLLTEKTNELNINVLRLGNPVRVSENILETTLDYKIKNHDYYKEIKKYKKEAEILIKKARSFKRTFGKQEYLERKELFREAKELFKLCKKTEDIILKDILEKTKVITSTLTGIYVSKILKDINFDSIFIDEASQALEPLTYLSILLNPNKRIVFVGDPKQLPPTLFSKRSHNGLKITLLEKLIDKYKDDSSKCAFLNIQYRMNDQILYFPNQEFYDNLLMSDSLNQRHSIGKEKIDPNIHLIFIDTVGADYYESNFESDQSIYNEQEAILLFTIFKKFYSFYPDLSYGILSPYKAQVNFLEELFIKKESLTETIEINTIDSFQGREKDCIFLSLTRSNDHSEIGFLSDLRRMNVAMTRAKKEFIIIGNSETLKSNLYFSKLIDHINNMGGYHSVWEFVDL
jgi:ATP-dependent RNA/DNA helicase IGHMBP2